MEPFQCVDSSSKSGLKLTKIDSTDGGADASGRTGTVCSRLTCADCAEILHGLNNVLASMLLNAQVMEWKMPSYSRGKRYLHEIERSAQRGGELLKRLLERLETGKLATLGAGSTHVEASALTSIDATDSARAPDSLAVATGLKLEPAVPSAAVIEPDQRKVPHTMV
jgi:hypothetical protein